MIILSIVTTCYNSESTIHETFESIKLLKNLRSDVEYIVVDGASTDNTISIIDSYKPIIDHFISEPDKGVYDGMNKGASMAGGKYILFTNSDDYVNPEVLHNSITKNLAAGYDFLGFGVDVVNLQGKHIGKIDSHLKKLGFSHSGMPCSHQGFVIRRKLFKELGSFSENCRISCDYELILKALAHSENFLNRPDCISTFRLGGMSYESQVTMEDYHLQRRYIGTPCAVKNLLIGKLSIFVQSILPDRAIRFVKKIKGSKHNYLRQ